MAKKYPQMTPEEKDAWFALDEYIRTNVMDYDENQGLNRNMVLRLKGLRYGQAIGNNNLHKYSNYTFGVILNTFKVCMPKIKRALATKNFDGDMNKFNYVMAIVENNISDVYARMKNAEQVKERAINTDMSAVVNSDLTSVYKEKTIKESNAPKTKNKFSDLW